MKARGWTPEQVDAIDIDEYARIIAFEVVSEHEASGEPIPGAIGGWGS